jgi:glycosyltransferase involved in cell wall biosynthesis
MRVVYIHQYFNTPRMPGGTRSYEMARRLVRSGHEVHMITSFREATSQPRRGWWITNEDGINVHWISAEYSNRHGFRRRIRAFAEFAVAACRRAAGIPADVIFATSTPLTVAVPAIYASWRQGIPMVFEVRDLWPEAPIQMGALKNRGAIMAARAMERAAYQRAAHVIGLSPGMVEGIIKTGIDPDRVSLIPNSSDLDLFHPDLDGTEMRRRLGLGGHFAMVYFGTMGAANGLGFVLDGAAELRRRGVNDVRLVLHGDGYERDGLMRRAAAEGLGNVVFSEPVADKADVARLARAADVCMTIYKDVPILYTCSPNKLFDSLAAGRPVLTNMPGWLESLVEGNKCGVFVRPGDAGDFADKAIFLKDNPELRKEYGRNARDLAERVFDRNLLARQLEAILKKAVEGGEAARFAAAGS